MWGYGIGLGMAVAGGVLAAHVNAGTVVALWWVYYPSLIVTVTGIVVGVAGLGAGIGAGVELVAWARERLSPPPALVTYEDPEPDDDPTPNEWEALEDAWAVTLRIFFTNGETAQGFSHSRLVENGKTMGETAWTDLTSFYASDEGGRVLRLDAAAGYVINHGWSYDYVRTCLVRRTLPHPAGSPPEVVVLPKDTTRRSTRRQVETEVV